VLAFGYDMSAVSLAFVQTCCKLVRRDYLLITRVLQ
jgi:hypothetical protein